MQEQQKQRKRRFINGVGYGWSYYYKNGRYLTGDSYYVERVFSEYHLLDNFDYFYLNPAENSFIYFNISNIQNFNR